LIPNNFVIKIAKSEATNKIQAENDSLYKFNIVQKSKVKSGR